METRFCGLARRILLNSTRSRSIQGRWGFVVVIFCVVFSLDARGQEVTLDDYRLLRINERKRRRWIGARKTVDKQ